MSLRTSCERLMADYHAPELDDVVHRLLPPEIFADIGIVDAMAPPSPAARRGHAVVEELAARLVGILRLNGVGTEHCPPPYSREAHRSQGCAGMDGVGSRARVASGGNGGMVRRAPGFGNKNGPVINSGTVRRFPRFVPTAPYAGGANPPPASTGTGVFLPRAEVYQTRASTSPMNGAKPPRLLRMEAANAGTMMKQQKRQQVYAMAAATEQKKALATDQFRAFTAPELLALQQEWTYLKEEEIFWRKQA